MNTTSAALTGPARPVVNDKRPLAALEATIASSPGSPGKIGLISPSWSPSASRTQGDAWHFAYAVQSWAAEQSGHITAVGFELYCQLLKQSVGALKGEKVKPRVEVRVALDFLETQPPAIVTRLEEAPRLTVQAADGSRSFQAR